MKKIIILATATLFLIANVIAQKTTYLFIGEKNNATVTYNPENKVEKSKNKNYYKAVPLFKFEKGKWQNFSTTIPKQKLYFLNYMLNNDTSYAIDSIYSMPLSKVPSDGFTISKAKYPIYGQDYGSYNQSLLYDAIEPLLLSNVLPNKCTFRHEQLNPCGDESLVANGMYNNILQKIENFIINKVSTNHLGKIICTGKDKKMFGKIYSMEEYEPSKFIVIVDVNMNIDAVDKNIPFNEYANDYGGSLFGQLSAKNHSGRTVFCVDNDRVAIVDHWVSLHSYGDFNNDGKIEFLLRVEGETTGYKYVLLFNDCKEKLVYQYGGN